MAPTHRLSLRTRATLAVAATGLVLSAALSLFAYVSMRSSLLDERQAAARRQADLSARSVRAELRSPDVDPVEVLDRLQVSADRNAVIVTAAGTYATTAGLDERALPPALLEGVADGRAGQQRAPVAGTVALVTGVPIADVDAAYFEVTSLDPVRDALERTASPLVVATLVATLVGAGIGASISGTILRPVADTSALARRIADGDVDARLEVQGDPDLMPLVTSFNEMVDELQARVDRERMFASNVSHELRGPLMVLDVAVKRVERQRHELPEQAAIAVDALERQVASFNRLVLDLLEISRFDAGTAELVCREVDLAGFARTVAEEGGWEVPVAQPPAPVLAEVDPRRMQQVLGNLLANAEAYAGGATCIAVTGDDEEVRLTVDDAGPGIGMAERDAIFQRFARGRAGAELGPSSGTGLGLALAAHHVGLHGGAISVEDAPGGGARFVVELPRRQR